MIEEWTITIWVAAHSTGNGEKKDQEMVGEKYQEYKVKTDTFDNAINLGEAIAMGIRSNPMVWVAEIKGIAITQLHKCNNAGGDRG